MLSSNLKLAEEFYQAYWREWDRLARSKNTAVPTPPFWSLDTRARESWVAVVRAARASLVKTEVRSAKDVYNG